MLEKNKLGIQWENDHKGKTVNGGLNCEKNKKAFKINGTFNVKWEM